MLSHVIATATIDACILRETYKKALWRCNMIFVWQKTPQDESKERRDYYDVGLGIGSGSRYLAPSSRVSDRAILQRSNIDRDN